jgi:hypothetical protein
MFDSSGAKVPLTTGVRATVTLPNGRKVKPNKNTYLKYYSGAFRGRVLQMPNGTYNYDQ